LIADFQNALPDLVFSVDDLVASADKIVLRWSLAGSHCRELFGLPASGRRVQLTGISIYRLVGGQVVESWDELDLLGLMVQIGALRQPS
jgi:predicted ester cyclase